MPTSNSDPGKTARPTKILRFALIAGVLAAVSCQRPPVALPLTQPTASAVVSEFFSAYRGDFRAADRRFLSRNLAEALKSAQEGEKASAARVKASEFPNDKPLILEGEVFAGLYEGFTGFTVGQEKTGDGQVTVPVNFRNDHYNVAWTDDIVLVEEDGWKIDDVRYSQKKAGLLSLRDILLDFEGALASEAANAAKAP